MWTTQLNNILTVDLRLQLIIFYHLVVCWLFSRLISCLHSKLLSSNCLFSQENSPKPSKIQFTIRWDKEKQQSLPVQMLKVGNFLYFCLEKWRTVKSNVWFKCLVGLKLLDHSWRIKKTNEYEESQMWLHFVGSHI